MILEDLIILQFPPLCHNKISKVSQQQQQQRKAIREMYTGKAFQSLIFFLHGVSSEWAKR